MILSMNFRLAPRYLTRHQKFFRGCSPFGATPTTDLGCDERRFTQVVKHGFGQRRKTLRNALKPLSPPEAALTSPFMDKRAEQLSVAEFVELTRLMYDV